MRIGQTSFVLFASNVVGSVLGFVATLYFARVLGAEVLGFYALVLVLVKWLKLGGEVGVGSAITKRISEGEDPSAYFSAGVLSVTALGLVTASVVLLFRDVVNAYVGVESATYIVVLVLIGLFGSMVNASLKGQRLVHVAGLLSPVGVGSRSVLQIALVIAGFGLSGMLLGYAGSGLVVGAIGSLFLRVGFRRPRAKHFRRLFDFAKYSWLGSFKARSFNDVDVLVLGSLVSPALVGVYSIAWSITSFVGAFGSSIRQSTFPEMSRASANERDELIASIVNDSLVFNGLLAIPALFGSVVLGDRLLLLYGREFTQGVSVLGLLILAMLIYDYQIQLLNALNAIDRPELSFRVNIVFMFVNLTLNVGLVLLMGWVGAAIATVLAAAIGFLLAIGYLSRLVTVELPVVEIFRQVVAGAVMAGTVFVVRAAVEARGIAANNNAVILVSLVVLGAFVYFSILLALSPRFRSTIADNSPIRIPYVYRQ